MEQDKVYCILAQCLSFFVDHKSTCHCLIHCLKMISIWALLLNTYYFMCKGACYQLWLFAIFAKFEDFSRSFLARFFSKCRILSNLLFDSCYFWDIFYSVLLGSKKNLCYFCDYCGIFGAPFCPFLHLSLEFY